MASLFKSATGGGTTNAGDDVDLLCPADTVAGDLVVVAIKKFTNLGTWNVTGAGITWFSNTVGSNSLGGYVFTGVAVAGSAGGTITCSSSGTERGAIALATFDTNGGTTDTAFSDYDEDIHSSNNPITMSSGPVTFSGVTQPELVLYFGGILGGDGSPPNAISFSPPSGFDIVSSTENSGGSLSTLLSVFICEDYLSGTDTGVLSGSGSCGAADNVAGFSAIWLPNYTEGVDVVPGGTLVNLPLRKFRMQDLPYDLRTIKLGGPRG